MINEATVKEFINSNWGNLCMLAYRSYLEMGRGLIGVKITSTDAGSQEAKMVYGVFNDTSQVDTEVLKIIAAYNPETEFIIQYMSAPGCAKTVCIKSGENKTPIEVWAELQEADS
jgi:hypothetical protein